MVLQSIRAGIHRVSLPAGTQSPIALDPAKLTDSPAGGDWKNSLPDLKELLRKNRIEIPMVETLIGKPGSEQTVRNAIDLCAKLKIPLLNIACSPPPESEAQKRDVRAILRDCARYAVTAGIKPALETYSGISHDGAECLRTLEAIGEPNLGINYDTGNVLRFSSEVSGVEMAEKDLRLLTGRLWALHLKDFRRKTSRIVIPGQGDADFPAIFRVLEEMNFSGVPGLDLEPTGAVTEEDYLTALRESLRYLRGIRIPANHSAK